MSDCLSIVQRRALVPADEVTVENACATSVRPLALDEALTVNSHSADRSVTVSDFFLGLATFS